MSNVLGGAALKAKINSIISKVFPKESCSKGKNCPCGNHIRTNKQGRPVTTSFPEIANCYVKPLPSTVTIQINENIPLIKGMINALVEARRPLTEEESLYISTGRDAEKMGLLEGEPTQNDVFIRLSVERKSFDDGTMETLGAAFERRAKRAIEIAQDEANETRRTLYVLVERYAVERNLRDEITAKKHNAPLSAVGLMSKNIVTLVVTDNAKSYKGLLARVATCEPEPIKPQERDEKGRFAPKQAIAV